MTSENFAEMIQNLIMCADEDVAADMRHVYKTMAREIAMEPSLAKPLFVRHVMDACREAFDMIDEAKEETKIK
jgi:hypothetical protein